MLVLWFQRYGLGLHSRRQRMARSPLRFTSLLFGLLFFFFFFFFFEHLLARRRRAFHLFLSIVGQLFQLRFLFGRQGFAFGTKQLPFQFRDVGLGLGQLSLHGLQLRLQLALLFEQPEFYPLCFSQLRLYFGQLRFGPSYFL